MTRRQVVVVPTGTANLASVLVGLERAGAQASVTHEPGSVERADFVVLPGVGALAPAMEQLELDALGPVLIERLKQGRPTLSICLGLQLLCEGSQESPGVAGLGVVAGQVERFPDGVEVPQMGWNRVEPDPECVLLQAGWAYFANSYRLEQPPPGWAVASSDHGGRFVAALERGRVLACQFHPELSGRWGQNLLLRWLDGEEGGGSC